MNQAILFPDMQYWHQASQSVVFPAQHVGALIECVVSISVLSKISGEAIENSQQALQVFAQWRFDLEELAETLIEDEEFNVQGQVEISE
ncbi:MULTISPECIES: DUF1488 domain-containing protein [Vibrio]|uniref:Transcriptional regulator n=1 Tax=Vibrio aestuarianus TaxID=28171 RepID=A0ABM9FU00_9VIBR|nr:MULTISPECIES: DUF1488 domain-containing protein [Vibrio]MBD1565761.1 DUF1488 domain-containing protein [Vibrio sp. S12_S33]MDE1213715.1 DUF1488 domain-containing protein [Vibrio aestuarianus]MDE1218167.1 DUF1488 domain-containing protein [Vibrio aestuarianus]MDE1226710.1 DUF1488 domain-containing protein [Vibrio aestuarianus]MDE1257896.1 DUF1488 domain-containing protein [Vibrio aestuarianus]